MNGSTWPDRRLKTDSIVPKNDGVGCLGHRRSQPLFLPAPAFSVGRLAIDNFLVMACNTNNYGDARFCHAPRTRPLRANARKGLPMLIKTSGQGFVSKAENAETVEYSTNRKANQQMIAIFK